MTFTGSLLPYQPYAVDRIVERQRMLVAYDLGLGKTVIAIAAIERLFDQGIIQIPGLIICLSSLKYQWQKQIDKFTDGTSTGLVIDGTPAQRKRQYEAAMSWQETRIDYIILNYEQVVNDWDYVSALPRGFVICDEATAIKGFRSKRSRLVKKLKSPVRLALTGTPIENGKPEELYSIMQFVDPDLLGRFDLFDSTFIVRGRFGQVERYRNLPILHRTLMQATVRKTQNDSDVAPFLPAQVTPPPVLVRFDAANRRVYQRIMRDLLLDLDDVVTMFGASFNIFAHYGLTSDNGGPADKLRGRLMSKIMALRMICDHPVLLRTSAQYDPILGSGSEYAAELLASGVLDSVSQSPKLEALRDYLNGVLNENVLYKVVVFTSFVEMTRLIQEAFPKIGSVTYTGQMNARQKETAKVRFQEDPQCRLFISSDAGGFGLDLPEASILVNYDLPWSSGLAAQRNGRIRRASSTWPTIVIQDFLIEGSLEERQRIVLDDKVAVSQAIIEGSGINDQGGVTLSAGSLRGFLQTSAV